ncbi:MAG: cell division protein CrgA [Egibacteraceae bacterium]
MPRSKSKRSRYVPPKPPKPKPSPRWVPVVGLGLIALGVIVVLVNYIFPGFLPGGNYPIIAGFVGMAAGLVVLSNYR